MAEKTIIITGANGFIGSSLCNQFHKRYRVIALDFLNSLKLSNSIVQINADLTNTKVIKHVCNEYTPDIIIHCAGIAHQKITQYGAHDYKRINSLTTENLAKTATCENPDVHFIFLSSISVYGEGHSGEPVTEKNSCFPTSDYAFSKLDAEKRLEQLYKNGVLKKLDILRLAPVYDSSWALNLERRVFAPRKAVYFKFGSGNQQMSALARPNLVDFIEFRINMETIFRAPNINKAASFKNTFNICDESTYSFKKIIQVFQNTNFQPDRPVVRIPLSLIWVGTRIAALIINNKRKWLLSCYDKLAFDLVFDNKRMLQTGFKPKHSLESILTD